MRNGFFLVLYDLFCGRSSMKLLNKNAGASFATMCLAMLPDVYQSLGDARALVEQRQNKGVLSSLLLTLARKNGLGEFLPRMEQTLDSKARQGKAKGASVNELTKELLKGVLRDLRELARQDESTMKRMLSRKVDAVTKSRMFGFGGGFGGGGYSYGFGGKGMGFGGYGYGQSFSQLEEMAKETERQLEAELKSMIDWPELKSLAVRWAETAKALPVVFSRGSFHLRKSDVDQRWVLPRVSNHSCDARTLSPVDESLVSNLQHLLVTEQQLEAFATAPLSVLGLEEWVVQIARAGEKVDEKLGFDVQAHPDAQSKVAQDMHARLVRDIKEYADQKNSSLVTLCKFLRAPHALLAHAAQQASGLEEAVSQLNLLVQRLEAQREIDMKYVLDALPLIVQTVNSVPIASLEREEERRRRLFVLRQIAGQECRMTLELLFCAVISSQSVEDLQTLNPFIQNAEHVLNLVVASILHASRVGQVNRCLNEAKELQAELAALQLRLNAPAHSVDVDKARLKETVERVSHKAETLATLLNTKRHYMRSSEDAGRVYDPRFLLFEFTWNIVLRKAQIELVHEFLGNVREGKPLVKQMLMGGGKTTVVGPLLTLMLADGNSLVVQMMPPALLEQTKLTLRSTFSSIIKKQVFILNFDRSSQMTWSTVDKLVSAVRNRGVVLATATAIKSIQLKLIEELDILRDSRRKHHPSMEHHVRALVQAMQMFSSGVLIMDEVDLLLHPLKSELNFPIGAKHPIDFTPERWNLAIHLIDAVFYVERKSISVGFQQSSRALTILRELESVIVLGYSLRALQKSPHLVLLNDEWYKSHMLPVMAQWCHLWLEANNCAGLSSAEILAYIMRDASILGGENAQEPGDNEAESTLDGLYERAKSKLAGKAFKMLNMATDWLHVFLPHCLAKIDRVSFGLLSMSEYEELTRLEPMMPRSRFKLAIPFVGKDVPSRASEFAHPDIIIGLTILAYRYEGLREVDFEQDVMGLLRASFEKEIGPFRQRKSAILHQSWVELAGGVIKGKIKDTADKENVKDSPTDQGADDKVMVPLWLLKASNDEQMEALFKLLKRLPSTIHWYLEQIIFPAFMQQQTVKISSSGTDIGGDIIFQKRIGFSGTPSDLLPISLGSCGYEHGSDGKMIHTLTDPSVTSTLDAPLGWTVHGLLDQIIMSEPHFNALIDTGALITGMSNMEVAQYIAHRSAWCDGVVFLDSRDEKRIYVKATRRVVKLAQCGIKKEKRFAFYDQIHTTGMDIQHMLSAKAVLTLGKDMVFRDFAQGAFRMRGIGQGQTVTVLVIPEVQELMNRQLAKSAPTAKLAEDGAQRLKDISAWLVLNAMRTERVQFDQLCTQNICNVWRKGAWDELLCGHAHFKVKPEEAGDFVLDLLGEAFVSAKGNVSRSTALEDKYVAIMMGEATELHQAQAAIKSAAMNLSHELALVWIPEHNTNDDVFSLFLQSNPVLAVPRSHAQRIKKILKFFGRTPGESQNAGITLVDKDGRMITRHGFWLFKLAQAHRSLEMLLEDESYYASEQKQVLMYQRVLRRERICLDMVKKRLDIETNKLGQLSQSDVAEVLKFVGKAPIPEGMDKALQDAQASYESARAAAEQLTSADVEMLRVMPTPSESIVAVVECACIAFGVTPDYDTARQKLLSFPHLPDSIKNCDKSSVAPHVMKQLHRRGSVALPVDAGSCATVLNDWIKALLHLDAIADDVAVQRERLSVSKAMESLCLSACDIFGIGDLDEDVMPALKLAEAVMQEGKAGAGLASAGTAKDESAGPKKTTEDDEKMEDEMEALEDKLFYLDKFKDMLSNDVELMKPRVKPAQKKMEQSVTVLAKTFSEVKMELQLSSKGKRPVIQECCLMLSLIFSEERSCSPADTCLQLLDCSSETTMLASATVLTKRVMEGTVIAEHLQQVVMLQEQIEEHYGRQDELKQFVQTKGGMAFVEATIALVDCLALFRRWLPSRSSSCR